MNELHVHGKLDTEVPEDTVTTPRMPELKASNHLAWSCTPGVCMFCRWNSSTGSHTFFGKLTAAQQEYLMTCHGCFKS